MVVAYDLLEDRCTIDVIVKKFFPLILYQNKMAETYENLEDVLPDWTEDGTEESLAQAVHFYGNKKNERNVSLWKITLKIYLKSRSPSRLRETQNGS